MALYTLAPWFVQQFFTDNGDPLAGGLVSTFVTGSSTPLASYADAIGTPNTNPIVLNAAGRTRIYLAPTAYKITVTDALGVPVGLTMDPVNAVASAAGAGSGLGEVFSFGSNSSAAIANTTYAVGATYDFLQPGTSVFVADSATLVGTFIIRATGLCTPTGTLSVSLVDLDSGAPNTPLATATITSATGAVADSGAIAFGAPGVARHYGIKCLVSANTGFLIGCQLTKTA